MLDPEKLEIFLRLVDRLLRPIELELGDEPLGEERLQVLEARLRLLELALRLRELGRRLRLRQFSLAFDHGLELELREPELVLRLRELLLRRDREQLQLILRLHQLRFRLRQLRFRALELVGEGLAVELHQEIAHRHLRSLGHDLQNLRLAPGDGGGVGHRPQRLEGPDLHDLDLERSLLSGGDEARRLQIERP